MAALEDVLREKAKKGSSEKEFPDMRLLVAASIPQDVGTASTWFDGERLNVVAMNGQVSPRLEQTKYFAAYLLHHNVGIYLSMEKRNWVEKAPLGKACQRQNRAPLGFNGGEQP